MLLQVKHKGYEIRLERGTFVDIVCNVWTPDGDYIGFYYTVAQAKEKIDELTAQTDF